MGSTGNRVTTVTRTINLELMLSTYVLEFFLLFHTDISVFCEPVNITDQHIIST